MKKYERVLGCLSVPRTPLEVYKLLHPSFFTGKNSSVEFHRQREAWDSIKYLLKKGLVVRMRLPSKHYSKKLVNYFVTNPITIKRDK